MWFPPQFWWAHALPPFLRQIWKIPLFPQHDRDAADTDAGWAWEQAPNADRWKPFPHWFRRGSWRSARQFHLPDESTVRVKGNNNSLNTLSYHCDGIYCEGELTFEGKGKLKIVTDSYSASAIYAKQGPVTFYDSVEIAADPGWACHLYRKGEGQKPHHQRTGWC